MATVYELSTGPLISESVELAPGIVAHPLGRLGAQTRIDRVLEVLSDALRSAIADQATAIARNAALADPVVIIQADLPELTTARPGEWEEIARPVFGRARQALTLAYGEGFSPFGEIAICADEAGLNLTMPRPRGLVFQTTEPVDQPEKARQAFANLETDERFAFLTSLYDSATRQEDARLRVAHLFTCLEALSSKRFQLAVGQGSRDAVRMMRRYGYGVPFAFFQIGNDEPREVDHIGVAGRIRDHLFHGTSAPIEGPLKADFELFRRRPDLFAFALSCDCMIMLANGRDTRPDQPEPVPQRAAPEGGYRFHVVTEERIGGHSLGAFVRRGEQRGEILFLPGFRDFAGGGLGPFHFVVPGGRGPVSEADKYGYLIRIGYPSTGLA